MKAGFSEPCPVGFSLSPRTDTPQPLCATCSCIFHPYSEKASPNICSDFPTLQLVPIPSCLISVHVQEELDSISLYLLIRLQQTAVTSLAFSSSDWTIPIASAAPHVTFFQLSSHIGGLCFTCCSMSVSLFGVQGNPELETTLQIQSYQCWMRGGSSPPLSYWLCPWRCSPACGWLQMQPSVRLPALAARDTAPSCSDRCPPGCRLLFLQSCFLSCRPPACTGMWAYSIPAAEILGVLVLIPVHCILYFELMKSYCWRCLYQGEVKSLLQRFVLLLRIC